MGIISLLEKRASLENPSTSLSNPAAWLSAALGGQKSATGRTITPDGSLSITTVWSAVRIISSTIATLPLPVYQRSELGKDRAPRHPLYRLLHDRPNPDMPAFVFRETMMAHLLIYGNAFAEIERNAAGLPIALWPIHPVRVRVTRQNGRKLFLVTVDGNEVPLTSDEMLHIPGFSLDGNSGLIPMSLMKDAVGLAAATEEFGSSFFGNGTAPSGILTTPGKLTEEGAARLKKNWNETQGGLSNAQRVAVLEQDMKWQPLAVPPEHAQFLETRKFQVTEIARIFLIPPHMLADLERATFSNIEHQSIQYVVHCIEPWTKRWEQVVNWELFGDRSAFFAEFVLEGLLRGDSAARSEFYTKLFNVGSLSPNDIRDRENMNRIEGGDQRFVPLNMVPLELAREMAQKAAEPAAPPALPEPEPEEEPRALPPPPDIRPAVQRALAHRALIEDAVGRFVRRESKAARRAAKRDGFAGWIEQHYDKEVRVLAESLVPVLRAGGCSDPEAEAGRLATEHVERSRVELAALLEAEDVESAVEECVRTWAQARPRETADTLTEEWSHDIAA